jgi:glycerol kinase
MEAVAYRLADVYEALLPLATPDHQIVVSGGAILGMPCWLQITADALGHALTAMAADDETTARGAALMAGVEAGILSSLDHAPDQPNSADKYGPDMASHERYRVARDRQARLEQTLVQSGEFV